MYLQFTRRAVYPMMTGNLQLTHGNSTDENASALRIEIPDVNSVGNRQKKLITKTSA